MQHRFGRAAIGSSLVMSSSLVMTLVVASSLVDCSGKDVSRLELANAPVEAGQLQLALTARGGSGALYRLRQAQFQVFPTGPSGSFAFLSSENDPLATSLETTLEIGDYIISLGFGWFLEKVVDGQVTRVQARLLSPESQEFRINANEETGVRYRFETDGQIVEFGQGRLIVEIEVDEQPGSGGGGPDGGVPGRLGEPLQIVNGLVSPDSNSHGINASFFAVTAPRGSTIQVTSDTGEMCVRGSMKPVENDDFANEWGVAFGLAFLSESGEAQAAWDLDGGNVTGFAFTVTGPDLPLMRLTALPGNTDPTLFNFCRPFSPLSGESFQMSIDSLDLSCWNGVRDPLITDNLVDVSWVIPADVGIGHTFDLCISDLRPILR